MVDFGLRFHTSLVKSMRRTLQTDLIFAAIADHDFGTLRQIAQEPGGFIDDAIRQMVWPILLHTHHGYYLDEKGRVDAIADPIQISKDVDRSLYYYPSDMSPKLKAHKQKELHRMIVEILWRNPRLKYYQGFHDICTCFLLVLGKKAAIPAAENVALFYIRDAMLDSFEPISKQLHLMSALIAIENPALAAYLESANIMPYYALSWILTWFSHDVEDFSKVARLFDYFIASSPLAPVYVASAITLLRRVEIMQEEADILHSLITNIPHDMDMETVIQTAVHLEKKYTPLQLQKQSGVWLHDESASNTWKDDWDSLGWDDIPDRIRVDQYLGHHIPKEEWEEEVMAKWLKKQQQEQPLC